MNKKSGFADPKRIKSDSLSRLNVLAGVLIIVVACSVAYIPAIKAGFIWDDDKYVTDNPLLTAPGGLYRIWFSTDAPSQYFPLTYTSFWVEHKLWGFNPMGYHIVNIAIHTINALLLWLVLRRLSIPGAWFASAVFALHPVQVESVAWITERKNLLMLLFSLLSVLCWIEFVMGNRTGRKAVLLYAGSLLLYALALFGKTTACTLPAALVLILWFKRSPLTPKRWIQIVPFVAIGIMMGLLAVWWENHHQGMEIVNLGLGPASKLLVAGRALWFYLWKLFWPVNLAFSYVRWHIDPASVRQYAWPAAGAASLVCLWFWRERLGRATVSAALFFVATLLPILGFLSLYTFVYSFVADHYQYAACIGPIALVSAGGTFVFRRLAPNRKILLLSAAGAILLTLGTLTWRQSRIYLNPETLWEDTLNKNPDSWLANGQMAYIRYEQGKLNEALMLEERRLALSPFMEKVYPSSLSNGLFSLGLILEKQGKLDDAVDSYENSLVLFENNAEHHSHFGEVLARQGKFEEAVLHFRRAVEIRKDFYDAYLSWGATLLEWAKTQQGQMSDKLFNESCEKYKKAAALRPDFYWAYAGWGTVLFEWAKTKEGQMSDKLFSESCEKFKKAAALRPDLSDGYAGWGTAMLGWAEKKGTDENLLKGAIAMLMKAEKLKRGSAAYNLACAWCILGDQDQCSRWLKVGEEEKTLPKRQVAIEDPDLKAIRDKEWFGLIRWDSE